MEKLDWIVLAFYFALLIGVAWWVISKNKKTAADYFLAGRNLGWWVIGASIFASNIGSEHVVGLAGSGARTAWRWPITSCMPGACSPWVGSLFRSICDPKSLPCPNSWRKGFPWFALCALDRLHGHLYRLQDRRGRLCRRHGLFRVIARITIHDAQFANPADPRAVLRPGGRKFLGWLYPCDPLDGSYVMLGGMRAVAYNDTIQVFVLLLGSGLLTIYGLHRLGGWGKLETLCGSEMFNLWKPLIPKGVAGPWRRAGQIAADLTSNPEDSIAWYLRLSRWGCFLRDRSSASGIGDTDHISCRAPWRPEGKMARKDVCRPAQTHASLHFHYPSMIR